MQVTVKYQGCPEKATIISVGVNKIVVKLISPYYDNKGYYHEFVTINEKDVHMTVGASAYINNARKAAKQNNIAG